MTNTMEKNELIYEVQQKIENAESELTWEHDHLRTEKVDEEIMIALFGDNATLRHRSFSELEKINNMADYDLVDIIANVYDDQCPEHDFQEVEENIFECSKCLTIKN